MSIPVLKQRLTPADYLAFEEVAEQKSEYYAGEMYAMAGTSPIHALISTNVTREFSARLRESSCRTYDAGLHVHVPITGLYTYPDLSVVCGPLQYLNGSDRVIVNPSLIVEILSPSTERYDRTDKFFHYQSIGTLRDYVLVAQDAARVEHYSREASAEVFGPWTYVVYHGPEAVLRLVSLGIEIPLREIYENVEIKPTNPQAPFEDFSHPGPPSV